MLVIDNFVKDREVLKVLRELEVWASVAKDDPGQAALCYPWNEVIQIMSSKAFPLKGQLEFWVNILQPGEQLDWHVDKNEQVFGATGQIIPPEAGCVWYGYPDKVIGGELHMRGDFRDEVLLPVYNRLIVFDVTRLHKVAPVMLGTRCSLQLNLW